MVRHSPTTVARGATALLALLLLTATPSGTASAQDAPKATQSRIDEGRRHLNAGRYQKAKTAFEAAVAQAPNDPIAHNELGVAMFQHGAPGAAVPSFRKAVELDPKMAHAWANLAEAQRLNKQYKRAALSYHKFLQLQAGDRYGVYGLALCFEGYESFDKALRTLQVAEKASQADPRLLARVNRAIKRVREKMNLAKLTLLDRGDAHLAAGRWQEAHDLYDRGLKAHKGDPQYLGRRGIARAILGDLKNARIDLKAALLKAPEDDVARAAYVLVIDFEGKAEPTAAAGTDSGDKMLRSDRAALAWRAFTRALEASADPAAIQLARGEAALRLGMLDAAEEDFSAAADDPTGAIGRAEVQWVRGQGEDTGGALDIMPVHPQDLPVWRRSLLSD